MSQRKIIFLLLFYTFYSAFLANCQEPQEISVGTKIQITVEPNKNMLYNFVIPLDQLADGNFFVFSTKPEDYLKPAFMYISLTSEKPPSPDNRDYSAQEIGKNVIIINKSEIEKQEGTKKTTPAPLNLNKMQSQSKSRQL